MVDAPQEEARRAGDALHRAAEYLRSKGVPSPRLDADLLLAYALSVPREALYAHPDRILSPEELGNFWSLIERRGRRVPLAYITGKREFMSMEFEITEDVLVPRPETENLVEAALERAPKGQGKFLDIGTGSGIIAVSLAKFLPEVRVWATDISPRALAVARRNAELHGVIDRITFLVGDLFEPVRAAGLVRQFDAVVSNPPYLSRPLLKLLEPEPAFEPLVALYGGEDGLFFYRRLLSEAPEFLREGGFIAMEIGDGQDEAITEMAESLGLYLGISILSDYAGHNRVFIAYLKG